MHCHKKKEGYKRSGSVEYFKHTIPVNEDETKKERTLEYGSLNQRLTTGKFGGSYYANPKTKINPVIVPRSHDLEHWKANEYVEHSNVNKGGRQDMYNSGYIVANRCPNAPTRKKPIERKEYEILQDPNINNDTVTENFEYVKVKKLEKEESGDVNMACGYDPEMISKSNLPSNAIAGPCDKSPDMARWNENLHTQIVTPGVYTKSQVIEPLNTNIGISFQQQFEPFEFTTDEKGIHYTQYDPRTVKPAEHRPEMPKPNYDNVYDPRFYGYGTSYRSYTEPVTGQTRFMYDDINAIRMPNHVIRSKVDHLPYADNYGPMVNRKNTANIRPLVQEDWFKSSEYFRNDITERRMRKINATAWEKRQNPLGPNLM